jgi:hypothetical protein
MPRPIRWLIWTSAFGQIDAIIEEAAKRRWTNASISAIEGPNKALALLADERNLESRAAFNQCNRSRAPKRSLGPRKRCRPCSLPARALHN